MSARSRAKPWWAEWRQEDIERQDRAARSCSRCGGSGLDPVAGHFGVTCPLCLGFGGRVTEYATTFAMDAADALDSIQVRIVELRGQSPTFNARITGLDE